MNTITCRNWIIGTGAVTVTQFLCSITKFVRPQTDDSNKTYFIFIFQTETEFTSRRCCHYNSFSRPKVKKPPIHAGIFGRIEEGIWFISTKPQPRVEEPWKNTFFLRLIQSRPKKKFGHNCCYLSANGRKSKSLFLF